ncbi:hypothetical protein ABGB16_31560, partial [Micromonospora sp. B11E3]|uniref:hypothetical protein n=1 Tax=Micromonospora sp. B11E3 TaxID=3153562 RepID=UPI00325EA798
MMATTCGDQLAVRSALCGNNRWSPPRLAAPRAALLVKHLDRLFAPGSQQLELRVGSEVRRYGCCWQPATRYGPAGSTAPFSGRWSSS